MKKKQEEEFEWLRYRIRAFGCINHKTLIEDVIEAFINKCLAEQAKEMIGEVEVTDCDDGYKTGVSKTGKRLSHNELIGYNIKNKEIIEIAKKYNINLWVIKIQTT